MIDDALALLAARHDLDDELLDDIRAAMAGLVQGSVLQTLQVAAPSITLRGRDATGTVAFGPDADGDPGPPDGASDTARYHDLGLIALGGMGEVRRVRDRQLNRVVCMKVVRASLLHRPATLARFVEEAQATAQLQHPAIVPVHELGRLEDGRPYFTMKEVRGRTFTAVIQEVHAASADSWQPSTTGWTFRQLVATFHQACQAIAFAHTRQVIHRDLKPDNIMVGDFGEVQVMDWGLAKVLGHVEPAGEPGALDIVVTDRSRNSAAATSMGTVAGTPAYMAPEQARGQLDRIDERTDVYALGAVLYELLAGRPPYEGTDASAVWRQVLQGPPVSLTTARRGSARATFTFGPASLDREPAAGPELPDDLVEICERAMARDPAHRHPSAEAVARDVRAWLDGTRRREQALLVLERADATIGETDDLRRQASALRARAEALLEGVATWAPEEDKAQAWALEDQAARLEAQAVLKSVEREQLLKAALTHAPRLPEAHAILAAAYQAAHEEAERARDDDAVARADVLLRVHVGELPEGHAMRQRCTAYLVGDGALSLVTDPPGAEVLLFRHALRNRRLVPEFERSLGKTPIEAAPLPMGSYLCRLERPGHAPVSYPVAIERQHHWDGVAPGTGAAHPVPLPAAGQLGPDDCYVPPGWFSSGGDPDAAGGLARRRLWCAGLVVRRYPVTNSEYVAFLDDLVAAGREAEALRFAPRDRGGEEGNVLYGRGPDGRFALVPDADGDAWLPDYPVFMVDWSSAAAHADWLASRSQLPWRLLSELEWEKASRGVDGRFFPWGDTHDPSWCCMNDSHAGPKLPSVVDTFPVDCSPYGIRGLAGNVRDWCEDGWRRDGPEIVGSTVQAPGPADPADPTHRAAKGGAWVDGPDTARGATRIRLSPTSRFADLGFRVARPYP